METMRDLLSPWADWPEALARVLREKQAPADRALELAELLRRLVPLAHFASCRLDDVEKTSGAPAAGDERVVAPLSTGEQEHGRLQLGLPAGTSADGRAALGAILTLAAHGLASCLEVEALREERAESADFVTVGEAMAGHPRHAGHVDVLHFLMESVEHGRLILPLSAVHYMELAENPRDHQREEAANVMASLSRFNTMASGSKILDEELALALNRRFGRPAFPTRVPKFGVGVGFAFGEHLRLRLRGGTDEERARLEARLGMSIADLEAQVNVIAEFHLLNQPSAELRAQIPGYDAYAARRVADRGLESFNVMLNTLRTDAAYAASPLDLICARQFVFEFQDNYVRAIMSAGFTGHRTPFRDKEAYTDFLMSLPSRRVAAMIQLHYLKDLSRDWAINDLRDVAALSTAIP